MWIGDHRWYHFLIAPVTILGGPFLVLALTFSGAVSPAGDVEARQVKMIAERAGECLAVAEHWEEMVRINTLYNDGDGWSSVDCAEWVRRWRAIVNKGE